MTAALAPRLLQHQDYPRVSSGCSVPSAQAVGWRLPWQGPLALRWEAVQCRASGVKEAFGETTTFPPHFDAIPELWDEVWEKEQSYKEL